jgi:2-dehydropantoate 2-reductase
MKIAIFGAGAIGGHLGAMLGRNNVDVSLIARGAHLNAMRDNGLKLITGDDESITHPTVTDDPATLGPQDYVVITLKSHQAPGVVDAMQPLLGPDTTVVTAMNGVPWWYFHKLPGDGADKWEGYRIKAVDPDNRQWDGIGPDRAIGCITYVASEVIEPGVVKSGGQFRYFIGEPDGSMSERGTAFRDIVAASGIKAELRPDLRNDIWVKLMGNVAYNPSSALTLGSIGDMVNNPAMETVLRGLMTEVMLVSRALGSAPNVSIDSRIETSRKGAGGHKTSMLQDLERNRPMEIKPIIGAVSELGKLAGVDTPTVDTVLALVSLRAEKSGLLP